MPEPSSVNASIKPTISLLQRFITTKHLSVAASRISAGAGLSKHRAHHRRWRLNRPYPRNLRVQPRQDRSNLSLSPTRAFMTPSTRASKRPPESTSPSYTLMIFFEHSSALSNLVQQIEATDSDVVFRCPYRRATLRKDNSILSVKFLQRVAL